LFEEPIIFIHVPTNPCINCEMLKRLVDFGMVCRNPQNLFFS
jgi:hypothetical protein